MERKTMTVKNMRVAARRSEAATRKPDRDGSGGGYKIARNSS
jgi:hypothetical protein